jgi:hypothetical protein
MIELTIKYPDSLLSVERHEVTEAQAYAVRRLLSDNAVMNLALNLRSVLEDLDDGGLTDDEALEQMRDILERTAA